ncbi:MAG: PQQ-dependent sugar dehydrogenase [Psychrobium sp.]
MKSQWIKIVVALITLVMTLQLNAQQKVDKQLVVKESGIVWGMTWLPNGDMLMTLRKGLLKRVRKTSGEVQIIEGLPKIATGGQGGLLDIILHPNYADNGWLYFSYAKRDAKGHKSTAIIRAKLKGNQLVELQDIYVAQAYSNSGAHFGSRLAFDNQGYLYFSIGDRGQRDLNPQNLSRDGGKIYRLHDDGRIPKDNPFVNQQGVKQATYSYGHRNPQGMVKHPSSGAIWTHEHGPRGGDEVNIIEGGENYGWPVISYGINYSGTRFTDLTEKEGMLQPQWYWDPSIAPSGMTFVTSNNYPQWQGKLLVGSLKFGQLVMLTLNGDKVIKQDIAVDDLVRVRNVTQAPDGFIYVALDGQGVFKLAPTRS